MRKDENGDQCPETLGEYYDIVKTIFGEHSKQVEFLKGKIDSSPNGRDEIVIAPDSQVRGLLFSM